MRESDVLKAVRDLLSAEGWVVHRLQSGTVRGVTRGTFITVGEKGLPDLVATKPEAVVYIEVKRPGGKLRPDQEQWIACARNRGFRVLVIDDVCQLQRELRRVA